MICVRSALVILAQRHVHIVRIDVHNWLRDVD